VSETFVVGGVDAGALAGDVDGSFDFVGQGAAETWTRGLLSEGAFGEAECPGTRCGFLVKIVQPCDDCAHLNHISTVSIKVPEGQHSRRSGRLDKILRRNQRRRKQFAPKRTMVLWRLRFL
jgi:hypothetical protein